MKYCRGPFPSCCKQLSRYVGGTLAWIKPERLKPDLDFLECFILLSVEPLQPELLPNS